MRNQLSIFCITDASLISGCTIDKYTPTYIPFTIDPILSDTTQLTVDMIYTDMPTVKNIRTAYDTESGGVTLSWSPAEYFMTKEYVLYAGIFQADW